MMQVHINHHQNILNNQNSLIFHNTQKEAENRLKYWTEYQIRNQKKAKNKILKTTEKANKIIENKPEIFI
jgi:hypothetical protein